MSLVAGKVERGAASSRALRSRAEHRGVRAYRDEPLQAHDRRAAVDVRRRRRHGVVHERPPVPERRQAAARRRGSRRRAGQLLPLPVSRAGAARPVSVTTEVGDCPWAPTHKLVLVGVRARADRRARSVAAPQHRAADRRLRARWRRRQAAAREDRRCACSSTRCATTIGSRSSSYAGASGVGAAVDAGAAATSGFTTRSSRCTAGGSTNGGEGLELAYRRARRRTSSRAASIA